MLIKGWARNIIKDYTSSIEKDTIFLWTLKKDILICGVRISLNENTFFLWYISCWIAELPHSGLKKSLKKIVLKIGWLHRCNKNKYYKLIKKKKLWRFLTLAL